MIIVLIALLRTTDPKPPLPPKKFTVLPPGPIFSNIFNGSSALHVIQKSIVESFRIDVCICITMQKVLVAHNALVTAIQIILLKITKKFRKKFIVFFNKAIN